MGVWKNNMKTLKKRRKENRTDYHKRLNLLKGGTPRVVLRKTNRYLIAQYVSSKEAQDKVEFGITSKKLLNYGWPEDIKGSLKSISAAYLTGLLFGKQIIKKSKEKLLIIDFGMMRNLHKTRIYAFLKGLVDSGIHIKYKKDVFPSEESISGKQMKNEIDVEAIKSNIQNEK